MIGFVAQELMELEVETRTGATHRARNPNRLIYRNGYRAQDWETRSGTVVDRPGFVGGSNSQIGWSHDKSDDEQVFS